VVPRHYDVRRSHVPRAAVRLAGAGVGDRAEPVVVDGRVPRRARELEQGQRRQPEQAEVCRATLSRIELVDASGRSRDHPGSRPFARFYERDSHWHA
jgi:hypothetical protein